ncbi:LytTR family DNA-binding domain-containing protein [Roseivirga sp. E12]|uniref:LytTR family DNA-binding domain-containing protein n=1 Tax=Roseivirga sp. E12 TaxID=2819237 RepID=UPI001ABC892A|nr:LytTR family DNA-binding domain-containing protein [Roseivirga sp. E12]MBO3696987.1 LytTR family transcriptional regulator [Roseivirga sp. E12]
MQSKTNSFSILKEKERIISIILPLVKVIKWKWVSIVLLGISCNTLVNVIFDYKHQRPLVSVSFEEYVNAIIASWILLSTTRWVSKKVEVKFPWRDGITRRLVRQVSLQFLLVIVLLNALVIGITYFFYGGFYSFDELMVINLSMVTLTVIFTLIDTGMDFSRNWAITSTKSNRDDSLSTKPIYVTLGKVRHLLKQENIRCATSESGSVMILTDEDRRLVYPHSLDALMKSLDESSFFRANRQTILSHKTVKSIKALDHGKIEVSLTPACKNISSVTISRTRASAFRSWLKSRTA